MHTDFHDGQGRPVALRRQLTEKINLNGDVRNNSLSSQLPEPLPLGPINLLVLTDVHSWIAGHARHESNLDMDYGDILSFYQQLKSIVRRGGDYDNEISKTPESRDLFLVMNGDFMDGTGLSTVPPKYLTPLLTRMPFSIINLGNHELYDDETVDWLRYEFIPHWRGRYLTSNTLLKDTGEPLGNRFTYLQGESATLLVFGFLYNFDGNCASTIVEPVEEVVKQEWFLQELKNQHKYDAILVMAHMHVTDPLIDVIHKSIRKVAGSSIPIQFVTGHTHVRAFAELDERATSFEAGRYLDTLGFCSFPTKQVLEEANETTAETSFGHLFLDANRDILSDVLAAHGETFAESTAGLQLSDRIHATQERLRLNDIIGCAPIRYRLEESMKKESSLWGLYMYQIAPSQLVDSSLSPTKRSEPQTPRNKLLVQGTGAFRYDLFQGVVALDDVISVCPFNDTIYQIATIQGWQVMQAFNLSSTTPNVPASFDNVNFKFSTLPQWAFSEENLQLNGTYDLLTSHFHVQDVLGRVERVIGHPLSEPDPVVRTNNGVPRSFWTTTDLWQYYIENTWPCPPKQTEGSSTMIGYLDDSPSSSNLHGNRSNSSNSMVKEEKPMTVVVFIVLIICGVYIYQKRRQHMERAGYLPIGDPTAAFIRTSNSIGRQNS